MNKNEYETYKTINKNSSLLPEKINLPFDYNDIRYLIVKEEQDVGEFRKIIGNEYGLNIPIFTKSQVENDFIGINHSESFVIDKININNIGENHIAIFQKIDVDIKGIVNI